MRLYFGWFCFVVAEVGEGVKFGGAEGRDLAAVVT